MCLDGKFSYYNFKGFGDDMDSHLELWIGETEFRSLRK